MTRRLVVVMVGLVALGGLAGPAVAEDVFTYDARGAAEEAGPDARTRALDAAFASAVTEAVADLAGAAARPKAAEIEREILRRARRFVASFQVKGQTSVGGRLELEVAVRVDRDKLRARLTELGVALRAVEATRPEPPAPGRKRAALLLRVVGAGPTTATFGAAASLDTPGLHGIAEALDRVGFAVVPPPGAGPAPGDDGALPVDDGGARALAGDVKAQIAVVVGIRVGALGPVRGAPLTAAPAEAHLRVLDVATGAVLAEATIASGAWGRGERVPLAAVEAAAAAIAAAAWPVGAAAPVRGVGDGPVLAARKGVTVRIRGARAWPAAAALKAHLAGAPGVERVTYAAVAADQVALAVVGPTPARVAGTVRTADGLDARVAVDGGAVEVLLGSPR